MASDKCEISHARLKIIVPESSTIEKYQRITQSVLLNPRHFIHKEKDNTYTLEDDMGEKIKNIDVETVVKCGEKETALKTDYLRLEGLPANLAISEIVYFKPSTNETYKTGLAGA